MLDVVEEKIFEDFFLLVCFQERERQRECVRMFPIDRKRDKFKRLPSLLRFSPFAPFRYCRINVVPILLKPARSVFFFRFKL